MLFVIKFAQKNRIVKLCHCMTNFGLKSIKTFPGLNREGTILWVDTPRRCNPEQSYQSYILTQIVIIKGRFIIRIFGRPTKKDGFHLLAFRSPHDGSRMLDPSVSLLSVRHRINGDHRPGCRQHAGFPPIHGSGPRVHLPDPHPAPRRYGARVQGAAPNVSVSFSGVGSGGGICRIEGNCPAETRPSWNGFFWHSPDFGLNFYCHRSTKYFQNRLKF